MEVQLKNNVEQNLMIEAPISDNGEEEEMDDEEMEDIVNGEQEEMAEEGMEQIIMEFTTSLTISNVNQSSHGVVICKFIIYNYDY